MIYSTLFNPGLDLIRFVILANRDIYENSIAKGDRKVSAPSALMPQGGKCGRRARKE